MLLKIKKISFPSTLFLISLVFSICNFTPLLNVDANSAFSYGDRIEVFTNKTAVRQEGRCQAPILERKSIGQRGTIVSNQSFSSEVCGGLVYWQIKWDDTGTVGWSASFDLGANNLFGKPTANLRQQQEPLKVGQKTVASILSTDRFSVREGVCGEDLNNFAVNGLVGVVVDGPKNYGNCSDWYKIQWENGLVGWSDGDYLEQIASIKVQAPSINISNPSCFEDVSKDNVFEPSICSLRRQEIVAGFHGNLFKPDIIVDRQTIAKFIRKGLEIEVDSSCIQFRDVSQDNVFYEDILTLKCRGIISGYDDATFKPSQEVNRAEAVKMIVRALELKGALNPDISQDQASIYTDINQDYGFLPYISIASQLEIVNGYKDKTFRPNQNIDRASMAKILDKARQILNSQQKSEDNTTPV
jgi:hypothetical protein